MLSHPTLAVFMFGHVEGRDKELWGTNGWLGLTRVTFPPLVLFETFYLSSSKDPSLLSSPLFLWRQTIDGDSSVRRCGVTEEKNVGHVRRRQQWTTVAKVRNIDREARIGKWADLLIVGWQPLTLCLYLPFAFCLSSLFKGSAQTAQYEQQQNVW